MLISWDGIGIVVNEICQLTETQLGELQIELTAPSAVSDINCDLHLPEGIVFHSASIQATVATDKGKTFVAWTNLTASSWIVRIAINKDTASFFPVENLHLYVRGKLKEEMIQIQKSIVVHADIESEISRILASIEVCNLTEGNSFAPMSSYRDGDIVEIRLGVCNTGMDEATNISISHMIRDYLFYVPNTLKTESGKASLVFKLIRWRIDLLQPGECTVLSFAVKICGDHMHTAISMRASYTFQLDNVLHGPYRTCSAILKKENRDL